MPCDDCSRAETCPPCVNGEDERRERYAAAMYATSLYADQIPWERVPESFRQDWFCRAEAAMAVADEEHARVRWDLMDTTMENARLRAELKATRRAKQENDERFQLEAAQARDLGSRVREVVDAHPNAPWYHGPSIRAALHSTDD